MFLEHFKLNAQPFGVTPDPGFLYLSQTHREALASLLYGIRSGRGFTALIAAPGMGKTTLLFRLLSLVATNTKTAFLFRTLCAPREFLRALLADLEIDDDGSDIARMHAKLNAYLLRESRDGRQVVVVIDEAQNLDERTLEMVRMLSNFETPGKKLMHIVLSGQPQLAANLAAGDLTQLRQRISILARLAPFTEAETREYIEHRLGVAGAGFGKPLFSDKAYVMIAEQSAGIPRNINNLCFNSMSLAWALKRPKVDALMVQEVINDLDLETIASPKAPQLLSQSQPLTFTGTGELHSRRRFGLSLAAGILAALAFVYVEMFLSNDRIPVPAKGPANISEPKASATSKLSSLANVPASQDAQVQNRTEQKSGGLPPLPQKPAQTRHPQMFEFPVEGPRLGNPLAAPKEEHVPFEPASQRENP